MPGNAEDTSIEPEPVGGLPRSGKLKSLQIESCGVPRALRA